MRVSALLPGLEVWLEAFWLMSTERQLGMSHGPIPVSCIESWADRIGAGREMFREVITEMDQTYLRHVSGESQPDVVCTEQTLTPALFSALLGGARG